MKNKFKNFCIAIIALCVVLVSGYMLCGGLKGMSAYEIAVQNGFTGTEQQWLASLVGKDGEDAETIDYVSMYNNAKATNEISEETTFLEFLQSYITTTNSTSKNTTLIGMQNAIRSSVSILSYYSSSAIPNRKYSIYNRNTDIARSAGSGVIMSLDDDGNAYIITNYHVTYTQQKTYSKVFVLLCEDSQFINTLNYAYVSDEFNVVNSYTKAIDAEYVGGSLEYDIAVLKISASDRLKEAKANNIVVAASLADPNEDLVFGQECYAVGNALNAGMTITRGIVSVPYEEINVENVENTTTGIIHRAIRTDAAINSGNSGGGFFDTNGNLIGIVFAKSSSSSVEDIGDVIPLSVALNVYNKILKDCDGTTVKPTFYDLGYEYEYTCNAKYNASSGIVELEESVYVSKISSSEYNDLSIGDQITGVQIVYSDGSATGKIEVNHYYTVEDLLLTASSGDTMIIYYTKTSTGAQNQELSVTFKSAQ